MPYSWTDIPDGDIDPDSPVTTPLMTSYRDNDYAFAEGASGAPKLEDAALDSAVTAAGTNWAANRIAGLAVGAVGSYAFLKYATPTASIPGATAPGSSLLYTNTNVDGYGTPPSGTWRLMGYTLGSASAGTVWLRIS